MTVVVCPECNYEITLDNPELKERFTCADCWADLQIVSLNPLKVAWFEFSGDEDYDDDDDDSDWELSENGSD